MMADSVIVAASISVCGVALSALVAFIVARQVRRTYLPPKKSSLTFIEQHTAVPVFGMAFLGLLLVVAVVGWFARKCGDSEGKLCAMVRDNPPWLLLSGLAAAPSVVLIWYWRTAHRKEDLAQKTRELDMRKLELEDRQDERSADRRASLRIELSNALVTLQATQVGDTNREVDAVIGPAKELPEKAPGSDRRASAIHPSRFAAGDHVPARYVSSVEWHLDFARVRSAARRAEFGHFEPERFRSSWLGLAGC